MKNTLATPLFVRLSNPQLMSLLPVMLWLTLALLHGSPDGSGNGLG